ncbi:transcriptional coactivator HFI1/ADA1 [Apiospora arundinis]
MPELLTLPDELLLKIQACLITRNDRFAFGATCQTLNAKFGGTFIYEQDVAEERDFDNARLRLERFGEEHKALVFDDKTDWVAWPEVLAAKIAKYRAEDEKNKSVCKFFQDCVHRWGPMMLFFTIRQDPLEMRLPEGPTWKLPQFPSSQWSSNRTLIYRAIMRCQDMRILGDVFDAYLNQYPAAIQGLKSGRLDQMDERGWGNAPVYLACQFNRVDVLDLLHRKGANINLVKGYLTLEGDGTRIAYDRDRLDMPYDPTDAYNTSGFECGFPEEVCLWLIEHNLGVSDGPYSLNPKDLEEAAVQGSLRLMVAMIKYFESRLSPEEYTDALTSALMACNSEQSRYFGYWPRRVLDFFTAHSGPILPTPQSHAEVLEVLLKAGASLRQDPEREVDMGLLARAMTWRPSNATWLLQQQIAAGATARSPKVIWGGKTARKFFATIIPEHTHLACDPCQIATPEGREQAIQELFDLLIQYIDRECCDRYRYDTALYFVEMLGPQRFGAELAHRLELSAKASAKK